MPPTLAVTTLPEPVTPGGAQADTEPCDLGAPAIADRSMQADSELRDHAAPVRHAQTDLELPDFGVSVGTQPDSPSCVSASTQTAEHPELSELFFLTHKTYRLRQLLRMHRITD